MFTVVLLNPEIPTNTGNIGRLTLGCGARLAVVGEPSFDLTDDAALRRAGLDYWPRVDLRRHRSWEDYLRRSTGRDRVVVSKRASVPYHAHSYRPDGHLIFGSETGGIPERVFHHPGVDAVRLPMRDTIRAYNLANSVAAVLFEALRQTAPPWFQAPSTTSAGEDSS